MADLPKRVLTDQLLRALKPPPKGQTYCVPDVVVPGFMVRVSHTGSKTFLLRACWNGSDSSATRVMKPRYPELALKVARDTAREWLELRANGKDPKAHKPNSGTLAAAMETWLAERVSRHRGAVKTTREVRNFILPRWGERSLGSLTRADVRDWLKEMAAKGYRRQPRALFGHLRLFFNWAIDEDLVATSPCERVQVSEIVGRKQHRDRTLTDAEIRALWRATEQMGYPWGTFYRLALLTGARRGELAGMQWSEIDQGEAMATWVVPAERFKMNRVHTVPLSGDAMAILRSVPRQAGGPFVLSATAGRNGLTTHSKAAAQLGALMAKELGSKPDFVAHDLRRTCRTGLAACGVKHEVAELVIGHAQQGLAKVYDQHTYRDEMLAALELWAARVRAICGANVVMMERRK